MDDHELASHLERRAGLQESEIASTREFPPVRSADAIRDRIASEKQEALRPWNRAPWPAAVLYRGGVGALGLATTGLVVVALAALLVSHAPAPAGSQTPPTVGSWLLTNAQLIAAVEATASDAQNVGRTVIAEVSLQRLETDCFVPTGQTSCPASYALRGSQPPVGVQDLPDAPPCPSGSACTVAIPNSGRMAVTIRRGYVSFVAWARTESPGRPFDVSGAASLWRDRGAALDDRDLVVDGWLSTFGGQPSCPYPATQTAGGTDAPFDCGNAAWLTAEDYQAISPDASGQGATISRPTDGIRVQNDAYGTFAPNPTGPGSTGLPEARRGLYLLANRSAAGSACFMCEGLGTAVIVARIDAIELAAAKGQPTAAPTNSALTTESSASPTFAPGETPDASAALNARLYADKFERSRATGDWAEAWLLLGPSSRAVFGSIETFATQGAAYNATGATVFEVGEPTQNPDLLNPAQLGAIWPEIVPPTAWYVAVNHPQVLGASAGLEGLIVASGTDGTWHVWIAH